MHKPMRVLPALIILVTGLAGSFYTGYRSKVSIEKTLTHEFAMSCTELRGKIDARLRAHAQLLRGGVAYFSVADTVTRQSWADFVRVQKIDMNLPGIQGLGFSLLIPKTQLTEHIRQIRQEGFSDYSVRPPGEREIYTSIIYLEPFDARNKRAFGYDMFSEPTRRAAMIQARDYNVAALSGKVMLVQETQDDVQIGTLMYVPFYRPGLLINTVEERRAAILGWVYSPYRMNDLMYGILSSEDTYGENNLGVLIYDNDTLTPDGLLFKSAADSMETLNFSTLQLTMPIEFNNKRWTLVFTQTPAQPHLVIFREAWVVLIGGIIISFLMLSLFLSILNTRESARQMALHLTQELRESEQKFRTLVENSSVGIYMMDAHENCLFVNRKWLEITGLSFEEALNATWKKGLLKEDQERIARNWSKSVQSLGAWHYEYCFGNANGKVVWISGSTAAFTSETGEIQGYIGTNIDITDRKLAEAERERLLTELARKNKELEGLVYIASHDLRSPLVNIQGFSQNLGKYVNQMANALQKTDTLADLQAALLPIVTDKIPRALKFIEAGSLKMDSVIDGLLRLSRIGRVQLQLAPIEMEAFIQSVLNAAAFQVEKMNARIIVEKPLASCAGDKNQLSQVFSNLLDNALKYHDPERPLTITFSSKKSAQHITYTVTDTGLGLAPESQEKIWELFYRQETNRIPGEGLGLPMARRIVERHNGRIWVESQLGQGSQFYVELPVIG